MDAATAIGQHNAGMAAPQRAMVRGDGPPPPTALAVVHDLASAHMHPLERIERALERMLGSHPTGDVGKHREPGSMCEAIQDQMQRNHQRLSDAADRIERLG